MILGLKGPFIIGRPNLQRPRRRGFVQKRIAHSKLILMRIVLVEGPPMHRMRMSHGMPRSAEEGKKGKNDPSSSPPCLLAGIDSSSDSSEGNSR